MTATTIQQLEQIRNAATDDFELRLFGAILALDAAEKAAEEPSTDEPGEMKRCAQCDELWPASDLFTGGLCPNCVIANHYEARQRRNKKADEWAEWNND
ncbi:MAG: hypothetical protein MOB07_26235 [Acidobacteria bacterium]|nr:hypothetical protein [Acidobacteriota bacterium]